MKFFLDTANIEEIRKGVSLGLVDGITTNPSLVAKEGKSLEDVAKEICDLVDAIPFCGRNRKSSNVLPIQVGSNCV